MQISVEWLREFVDIDSDVSILAEKLTLAGLEVSAVNPVTPVSSKIVVGEIVAERPHPSKKSLQVCEVAVGRTRTVRIVCGAPNARSGVKAPVALPGSSLHSGKIRPTNIGGETSSGVLCSAAEIGLEESSDRILELDKSATIGQSINGYLNLYDAILDIELTPNRGDCLSALGLAREIGAVLRKPVKTIGFTPQRSTNSIRVPISVTSPADAPRYVGRVIAGLDATSATPDWMKEKLRRSGLRSLGSIVDITNFVMLELGQPLHAFDLHAVHKSIVVRHALHGETLILLDGTELELLPKTLVIADQRGPIGLAGVMGGQSSAVNEKTQTIFLESAFFRPNIIAGRAREYGLQTDASYRFERGVDPDQQRRALLRASKLLSEICNGEPGPVCEVRESGYLPKKKSIVLRKNRLDKTLGVKVSVASIRQILSHLAMTPIKVAVGWKAKPPSYRFDINGEHDLVEEVARLHGFVNIPSRAPRAVAQRSLDQEKEMPLDRFQDYLIDRDYSEVITYSFVDGLLQARIDPEAHSVELENPIASNMNVMRTTLWPGLLHALGVNHRRQIRRLRLFEVGHVFSKNGKEVIETQRLGGVASGPAARLHWDTEKIPVDFFDMKGDLEGLLSLDGRNISYEFLPAKHPALHPGQSAEIHDGPKVIGHIGCLHPVIQKSLDLDFSVYLFEIDFQTISNRSIPTYRRVSRFPLVLRDLSISINHEVPAAKIEKAIWTGGGPLLTSVRLFDVYAGKELKKRRKSLSFSLTLQSSSRNLTDREVETVLGSIVAALENLGGQLRSAFDPKS